MILYIAYIIRGVVPYMSFMPSSRDFIVGFQPKSYRELKTCCICNLTNKPMTTLEMLQ